MGLTLINVFRCFRILGYFVFEIFQVKEQIVKLFRWVISSFALCQKYFLAAFVTRYIVRWWHYCQYKTFCQTVVIAANKGTGIWNMSILPKKKTWAMVLQWQGKIWPPSLMGQSTKVFLSNKILDRSIRRFRYSFAFANNVNINFLPFTWFDWIR